jgi:hypothetical protein
MPEKPLRETLAEIKKTQHCPQQKIQRIVLQIAFEPILHRDVAYLKPVGCTSRSGAATTSQRLRRRGCLAS